MEANQLDTLLKLQLLVAWAGEARSDPPRLGWWRTGMVDEFGGEDLLRRLAPRTWRWAVLEAARAAARRVDDGARSHAEDPDHLVSLFRYGFELDEQIDDRLRKLKQGGEPPELAFPELAELMPDWSQQAFEAWLAKQGEPAYANTSTGRQLKGAQATDPVALAKQLAAALLPLGERYPLPYLRLTR